MQTVVEVKDSYSRLYYLPVLWIIRAKRKKAGKRNTLAKSLRKLGMRNVGENGARLAWEMITMGENGVWLLILEWLFTIINISLKFGQRPNEFPKNANAKFLWFLKVRSII